MIGNYVTTKEAVEILEKSGIKRTQGYMANLCASGEFKNCSLMGNSWVIDKDEIEVYKIQHLPEKTSKHKPKRGRNADATRRIWESRRFRLTFTPFKSC